MRNVSHARARALRLSVLSEFYLVNQTSRMSQGVFVGG